MKSKMQKVGVSVGVYALMLTLFGKLMATQENSMEMLCILGAWSMINIFCRSQKKLIFALLSYGLTVTAVLTLTSVMLTKQLTILAPIDKIAAETIGLASGALTKLLVGFVVWAGIWIMNLVVDNLCLALDGEPKGIKKAGEFFSRIIGPVALASMVIIASNRDNKTESKNTANLLIQATSHADISDIYTDNHATDFNVERLLANPDVVEMIEKIKYFENGPLHSGAKKVSVVERDPLKKKKILQVGYGVTDSGEIVEAVARNLLPKGTRLPKRMTKQEADEWFAKITFPLYLQEVKEVLNPKIKLTPCELVALAAFCHNLGQDNLRTLINSPGRLNEGNFATTKKMMKKYVKADGVTHKGLVARRELESSHIRDEETPPANPEPPTLIFSKR